MMVFQTSFAAPNTLAMPPNPLEGLPTLSS
jgi:hypothetical protein